MPQSVMIEYGARSQKSPSDSLPAVAHHLLRHQRLYAQLRQRSGSSQAARLLKQHFDAMPPHFWERVTKTELLWALEILQRFATKTATSDTPRSVVVADSRYYPQRGVRKVLLAAWDRPGLLAKVAAAFSALRINIVRADVYTRADGIALDLFEVEDTNHDLGVGEPQINHLIFLMEGALSEPPRFVSVWASEFHKTLPRTLQGAVTIEFDQSRNDGPTVIQVEAADRLGLLHDLLRAFTQCGLNVVEAQVETNESRARDVFYVTEVNPSSAVARERWESIRRALLRAIG